MVENERKLSNDILVELLVEDALMMVTLIGKNNIWPNEYALLREKHRNYLNKQKFTNEQKEKLKGLEEELLQKQIEYEAAKNSNKNNPTVRNDRLENQKSLELNQAQRHIDQFLVEIFLSKNFTVEIINYKGTYRFISSDNSEMYRLIK